ncbi:MAG TPA: hypothetical protein VK028_05055 [Micromonosporaceae bacterium]|nr:hypothetical protein [Micromonosporaceae bacterium]
MRSPSPTARAIGIAVGITIALVALVSWFTWPAKELAPRDVPIVVAGPAPAASGVAQRLDSARPGAFEVTLVPDEAAADAALRDRSAYAAFIVGPSGMSLHTASGASPALAQLLGQAAQELGGAAGAQVEVVDVVPGSPGDPRGAGFASGFLPFVLLSMVAGIAFSAAVTGKLARLVGLLLFALLAGTLGAAVLQWLDILAGSYLATAGAVALLALAVSASIAGLAAVAGPAGIGLGVLVIFLFGNPLSAVAAAPELLPQPWGMIGQYLPIGAGATLLRSVAFFDGAGSAMPLWTLAAWAVVGLVLVVLGRARIRHVAAPATAEPAPAATS